MKRIVLVGNPNVGKSVVFSRLTGVHVHISNYPGTTVEYESGLLKIDSQRFQVIDAPGTYSLEPNSKAEEVAVDFIKKADFIINVVDATNLERNLYLTLELIESGIPVIVCLNMCDDTKHRGIEIDFDALSKHLGAPVISTCAVLGQGIKQLIASVKDVKGKEKTSRTNAQRWEAIGEIVKDVQKLSHRHHSFREILEDASIHHASGLAIAAAIAFVAFKVIRFIGEGLIGYVLDPLFNNFYLPILEKISAKLAGTPFLQNILIGQLIDGAIDFQQSMGLMTTALYVEFVMVLPYIIAFYLVLGILEDIGYLPRLAYLLDNILHKIGLHGFSVIPVLLGFGCNVPGILATRSLESRRERFIAATLISIGVPCAALQAMIIGVLGEYGGMYIGIVYLTLVIVVLALGFIMNKVLKGFSPEFLLEIPPYRGFPVGVIFKKLFMRVKAFLKEAIPVVMLGVLMINIMDFFGIFDIIADLAAPVIKGLLGLPKEAVGSLVVGFVRKDIAVGLLTTLGLSVKQLVVSTVVLAMTFPCIATFVILFKELGIKDTIKSTLIMISISIAVGALLNLILSF